MIPSIQSGPPSFLVVGLGNIGKPYENTRHNVGFAALDRIAERCGVSVTQIRFRAMINDGAHIGGARVILMKPTTLMNLSGEAVSQAASFYRIPPANIIVLCDDVNFDVGMTRIRAKGSHGGHNGLRNITDRLGSSDYPRVKIGVGKKPHPDYDLADWVLSKYKKDERPLMEDAFEKAAGAAKTVITATVEEAMNKYSH